MNDIYPTLRFPNAEFMCFLKGNVSYEQVEEYKQFLETEVQELINERFRGRGVGNSQTTMDMEVTHA